MSRLRACGFLLLLSLAACSHSDKSEGAPDLASDRSGDLAGPPSGLTYATNPAVFHRAVEITPDVPMSSGAPITSYAVAPALPTGLTLDGQTGVLSGTPTTAAPAATYVVTGSNTVGSTTASLSIEVTPEPPMSLTYAVNPAVYVRGTAIVPDVPSASGDPVDSWSVSPMLPAGLVFDTATGIVSGTPTVVTASALYTVTATNAGGSASVGLAIGVTPIPPSALSYSPNPAVYTKGIAISPSSPTVSGDPASLYTVSPALPAGLAIDPSTGIISGTATVITAQASYVVTAANAGGSTSTTLVLTVNDQPPRSVTYADADSIYDLSHAITPNTPTVTGGTPTAYTITPATPAGIVLDATTGVISGTPTVKAARGTYTIHASNNVGSVTTTVEMGVFDFGGQRFMAIPQNLPGYTSPGTTAATAIRYDGTHIYAGTYAGLSISSDGGSTWVNRTTFDGLPSYTILSLELVDGGLLVGTMTGAASTTDGVTFTPMLSLAGEPVASLVSDGARYYAAVNSTIYVSADEGATFPTTITAPSYIRGLSATPDRLCVATTSNGAQLSTDGGKTFVTRTVADGLGNNAVYSIYCQPQSQLVLAGTTSGLSVSTDGGVTFVNHTQGLCNGLVETVYADGSTIYAGTFTGLSISKDGGSTFTCVSSGPADRGVFATGADIFRATDSGVLVSTNAGTSYTTSTAPTAPSFPSYGALAVSGSSIDLGGVYGAYHSANGGTGFATLPLSKGWVADIARAGSIVVAGTSFGAQVSADGGNTFTLRTTTDGLGANSVPGVAVAGSYVYAGTPVGLGVSSNSGTSFVNRTTTDGLPGNAVSAVAASGATVLVATSTGLGVSTDHGTTFAARTTTQGLASNVCTAVFLAPNGDLFVGHNNGKISRSTDGGATFTVLTRGLSASSISSISVNGETISACTQSQMVLSLDGGTNFWPMVPNANGQLSRVVFDSGYLYSAATSGGNWGSALRSQNTISAASP